MAATLAQELENVQAAIEAIEKGAQSISFEGQTITKANLKTLYDREEKLQAKIDRADRGRINVAQF